MQPIKYYVKLHKENDCSFFTEFPQLGGFSVGKDKTEALANSEDLLVCLIEDKIKTNAEIPTPKSLAGCHAINLKPLAAAKLQLYWEMKKQGIKKAGLARKLKWHGPQVDRLLDVTHESKISQLEAAFFVLGKRLVLITF